MKLLALHGYMQNGRMYHGKTNALCHHLKKCGVELIFLDGPYTVQSEDPEAHPLAWLDGSSYDLSLEVILRAHEEHPDVVGLFGFSQGSMLALKIISRTVLGEDDRFNWIQIMVAIASRCPPPDHPFAPSSTYQSPIPILFVVGETDAISDPEGQKSQMQYFPNATLFEHPGGHYVPASRNMAQNFIDFFNAHQITS